MFLNKKPKIKSKIEDRETDLLQIGEGPRDGGNGRRGEGRGQRKELR